jgi:RHS repeat-associated protein
VNRFKFLGRETQAETGWVDLMQRMYEPPLGRFTSVDPVTASQESLSTYQYGWNNPVLRSDRNGDCPECPESGFLIARLMTTAFYDTKHAIANSAFRAVRSDLRADYKVENGQQVFETSYTRQPQDNSVSGVAKEVINTIADVAVVVGVKGGGGNIGLLSKTSETQGVRAAKDVVNLRHYTSNKGIEGIQKDLEIKAFDQNKIFAEKANGKPLSSAQASEKYGINKKDARNYIEFQVPASSVEKVNNATTGSIEQTIRGNVKLNPETTKFVKRNQ